MTDSAAAAEQDHLDRAYAILDSRTASTRDMLRQLTDRRTTHAQNRLENEALASNAVRRLAAYDAASRKLCFGVVYRDLGDSYHIGRIGLADTDQQIIQVDWRAPAAAPFYQATAAAPCGLQRRRRITTEGRNVTALYDEVFSEGAGGDVVLSQDAVLLAALGRDRTGKMGDIVETIQHEQDTIVRSEHPGVLVVEGGPGTGKTVVALHRAAFLLYRDREKLERSGVLVIGPTDRFLTYIDDVLPGLGETGVVLATIGDLVPGANVTLRDHSKVAEVKSDPRLAEVISRAVQQLRRIPAEGVVITCGTDRIVISQRFMTEATRRAFAVDSRHNVARPVFIRAVVEQVIDQLAQRRGVEIRDAYERSDLFDELNQDVRARATINRLWMPMDPQQLVATLWRDPQRLRRAADRILIDAEQELLFRSSNGWSLHDIPIIDEAAELLGPNPDSTRTVDFSGGDDYTELHSDGPDFDEDLSARALADRDWVYGHCIVDEAQELTPMQWRMLARKVPTKSMTVVGDLAQASTPGACTSWSEALDPIARGRWVVHTLSVNYRTPASIAAVAEQYLRPGAPLLTNSVRDNGLTPFCITHDGPLSASDPGFMAAVRTIVDSTPGLSAVIAPRERVIGMRSILDVDVLTVAQVKGLEFDNIVLVDPIAIESESGRSGLYVALTRATRSLAVMTAGHLPGGLDLRETAHTPLLPDLL